MAQVTITIDGKQFRMACDDGQEAHLESLAAHLDAKVKAMRQAFGEIGDQRLTVMAALMICDELSEEKKKHEALQAHAELETVARSSSIESELQRDTRIAQSIDLVSTRIERITGILAGQRAE